MWFETPIGEERLGGSPFLPITNRIGFQGAALAAPRGGGATHTKPRPSLPGNCFSFRVGLTLTKPGGRSSRPAQPPVRAPTDNCFLFLSVCLSACLFVGLPVCSSLFFFFLPSSFFLLESDLKFLICLGSVLILYTYFFFSVLFV